MTPPSPLPPHHLTTPVSSHTRTRTARTTSPSPSHIGSAATRAPPHPRRLRLATPMPQHGVCNTAWHRHRTRSGRNDRSGAGRYAAVLRQGARLRGLDGWVRWMGRVCVSLLCGEGGGGALLSRARGRARVWITYSCEVCVEGCGAALFARKQGHACGLVGG